MARKGPLARTEGMLTKEVDGEFLVYNEEQDVACKLNATAALIWRSCDGKRTLPDLVRILEAEVGDAADEDMVLMALDGLAAHELLLSGYEPRGPSAERLSRRRFFRRAGISGAAAIAAPVVYTMAVPAPALASYSYSYSVSDRRLKRNIRVVQGRR